MKQIQTLALLLFMGGGLLILHVPIQRNLSSSLNLFEGEIKHVDTNHSVGNLRQKSASSPKSIFPDTSPKFPPIEELSTPSVDDEKAASPANLASHTTVEKATSQYQSKRQPISNDEKIKNDDEEENSDDLSRLDGNEIVRPMDTSSANSSVEIIWNKDALEDFQAQGANFDRDNKVILVGDEKGYIKNNGQLVVNVNETYLFWHDGQQKLCNLLQNMTLATSLDENSRSDTLSTIINVTMDCVDHNENKQGLGQGNWITAVYAARMAAFLAGVDFHFQCSDGKASKMSLLLPWFDKYQVAKPMNRTSWPHGGDRPSAYEACPRKYPFLRIDKMAFEIQDDLRKMAVSLVGTRDEIRQHPSIPADTKPLIPGVELDDVALHFRCGDVLGGARRNDFGMIRFNEYKKWIPNTTESIGILTQPFEKERNRGQDSRKADSCRTVVHALVDYLQAFAPNARISIHNGANETHPLAYARLVMANHSITSLSSFGIFPIIGTFGQGYFQKGNRGVNPFATHVPGILPNVHQMEADVRGTGQMWGKSIENLVEWFVNDTSTN